MLIKLAFRNVRKSFSDFALYFITVAIAVAVFYSFNSVSEQQSILDLSTSGESMLELLGMCITGVSIFLAFILVFLVAYANRFLIKRRKREFGMYLALGMSSAHVRIVVLIESVLVGLVSLFAGILLGLMVSQGLLHVSSLLFNAVIVEDAGIHFLFSWSACAKTTLVFGGIFVASSIVNVKAVSKSNLVDLMKAHQANEPFVMRNVPLCAGAMVVSFVLMGVSYWLLERNGLTSITPELLCATILVILGTVLFYFSLSSILLRAAQSLPSLYYRGLTIFTVKQLGSKIVTASTSLAALSFTLFLALTFVCSGIGLRSVLMESLDQTTPYSASVSTTYSAYYEALGYGESPEYELEEYASSIGFDVRQGLVESVESLSGDSLDDMIFESVQINRYIDPESPITFGDIEQVSGLSLSDSTAEVTEGYQDSFLFLVPVSQVNAALEMQGKNALELSSGQCALMADSQVTAEFLEEVADAQPVIDVSGSKLEVVAFSDVCLETTALPLCVGIVVVPDEDMPQDAELMNSVLNVNCLSLEDEEEFYEQVSGVMVSDDLKTYPVTLIQIETSVTDQNLGLSAVVAYLATYVGLVLVVVCAAVLALQQLTEASDSISRYRMLNKLGVSSAMINRSLRNQIVVYFLLPLIISIPHSVCVLNVVVDVVAIFGKMDIESSVVFVAGGFLVIYGLYGCLTYFLTRNIVTSSK